MYRKGWKFEAISKIPLVDLLVFYLHASFFFLPRLREYELRKKPCLEEKSFTNLLKPIFEMASNLFLQFSRALQ
jgi:hypothetical protein